MPLLSRDSKGLQTGAPGAGVVSFPSVRVLPAKELVVFSLQLMVRGTAQDIWAPLALVLGPLGLSDLKAQLLTLRALSQEESQLCPHPGPACVCATGICVGAGGTCQGPWSFRDLCLFTGWAPGCVSVEAVVSVTVYLGQSIKV